ncbi:MAG: hypothetical protein WBL61_14630 [Bryobacteraceae bacterium]|jgi:hypothetical protein
MSDWQTIDVAANAIMQQTFGEPVVYQSAQAGMAVGDPVTITAIRHARVREESGALANVEEISVNPSDLASFPQRGDWVTAWGLEFVVTTVRQPDPHGLVELSLMARAGQSPND